MLKLKFKAHKYAIEKDVTHSFFLYININVKAYKYESERDVAHNSRSIAKKDVNSLQIIAKNDVKQDFYIRDAQEEFVRYFCTYMTKCLIRNVVFL